MTTLVALKTLDCLVMGCDSLATTLKLSLNPFDIMHNYFDPQTGSLIHDDQGQPKLNLQTLFSEANEIPDYHIPYMKKLFILEPYKIAIMTAGTALIGDNSIRSLVNDFKHNLEDQHKNNDPSRPKTVYQIVNSFRKYISRRYSKTFKDYKPTIEFLIGGYSETDTKAVLYRLTFNYEKPNGKAEQLLKDTYGIATGGQTSEIDRIIFGTDGRNRIILYTRFKSIIDEYYSLIKDKIDDALKETIVKPDSLKDKIVKSLFGLSGLQIDYKNYSDQNAIRLVKWLVELMINAQYFNMAMPTVGGPVHIALINKDEKIRILSEEEIKNLQMEEI